MAEERKYSVEISRYEDLKDITTLPKYQRKLVWSKGQKEKFIESIREGFPFGSLLVYKYENNEGNKLSIIDGLQRFSTLKHYENNKHEYFPIEAEINKVFEEIFSEISNKTARAEVVSEYKKCILDFINKISGMDQLECAQKLKEVYATNWDLNYFYKAIQTIEHSIKTYVDLDNLNIPYVYFKGNVSDLAEVFQRLNQGGVKLSKYQVFASSWVDFKIQLEDKIINSRILDVTVERYNRLNSERQGIIIEDYEENEFREEKTVNLAELCYALGILILEKSEVFFIEKDSEDLANEIGYATMAIVLGIENNKLANISDATQYMLSEDIEIIFEKILDIYVEINELFKSKLCLPCKKGEKYFSKNITNFMYLSYFASLWTSRYETDKKFNLKEKQGSRQITEIIKSNLIQYYIFDSISGYWSATGDKKLNELYASSYTVNRYLDKIDKSLFEQNLINWVEEEYKKTSVNIPDKVKLIITILNNLETKGIKQDGVNNVDFEHIYVRKYLNKAKKEHTNISTPGGHLGNVCLLTEHENRKKKDNTLYFSSEKHSAYKLDRSYLEIIEYPSKNKIEFVDALNTSSENIEIMRDTILNRSKSIINTLVKYLYS